MSQINLQNPPRAVLRPRTLQLVNFLNYPIQTAHSKLWSRMSKPLSIGNHPWSMTSPFGLGTTLCRWKRPSPNKIRSFLQVRIDLNMSNKQTGERETVWVETLHVLDDGDFASFMQEIGKQLAEILKPFPVAVFDPTLQRVCYVNDEYWSEGSEDRMGDAAKHQRPGRDSMPLKKPDPSRGKSRRNPEKNPDGNLKQRRKSLEAMLPGRDSQSVDDEVPNREEDGRNNSDIQGTGRSGENPSQPSGSLPSSSNSGKEVSQSGGASNIGSISGTSSQLSLDPGSFASPFIGIATVKDQNGTCQKVTISFNLDIISPNQTDRAYSYTYKTPRLPVISVH